MPTPISEHSYDHTKNAGNQGDVAKHVLVANLLASLARNRTTRVVYAESHCGRSAYVLPSSGEWTRGIGKLFALPEVRLYRSDRNGASIQVSEITAFLDSYAAVSLAAGTVCFGSSKVAQAVLRRSGTYEMQLWDNDPAVVDELMRSYAQDPNVSIHVGDGYAGVRDLGESTLVLVDPPDIDAERVLELAETLTVQGRSFVAWTPLRSRSGPKGGTAAEAATSRRFMELTARRGFVSLRVQWSRWGDRTPGCQLTVSADIGDRARRCLHQIAGLMRWQYADDQ